MPRGVALHLPDRLGLEVAGRLSPRQLELAFLLHMAHPPTELPDSDVDRYIADVQPSMGRVHRRGWTKNSVCTIIASAKLVLRTVFPDGKVTFHVISGVDRMSLMGWDISYYRELDAESDQVLCSLAGNAFSAFSAAPVLISIFGLAGKALQAMRDHVPPPTPGASVGQPDADAQVASAANADSGSSDSD